MSHEAIELIMAIVLPFPALKVMLFFRLSQALAVETFFIVIYGLESLILPLLNQK
jgi:hypothetical protein